MAIKLSNNTIIDDSRNIVDANITTTAILNVGTGGTIITTTAGGFVGINSTVPGSVLAVGGTITELYNGTFWNVVSQADVGYGASQVPLNQYLGQLAFLDDFSPNGLRRDGGGEDDLVISLGGFVGIGTTNPTSTLHVVGNISAGTITANLDGTAVNLSTNSLNWSTNGTITAVVGQLAWKNYGNNHTIFDASGSTSPSGSAVNSTNSQIAWSASYPTLMGWNGSSTYGVRVDSARISDAVTTNANLTGDVTSVGNATAIAAGVIVNADINVSAGIVDTKLATIGTAGKVSNSATTATNANTASTIVARDASGNFSAGTITAALTGNAATATTLATTRTIWGQNFNGSANVTGALSGATTIAASSTIQGTRLISTVATGTAPLSVASTTVVTNLNADLLDGLNSATANTASTIVARDASGNFSAGTITAALTGTAANVTTNANLTGHVTSVGNAAVLGSFTSAQLATALTDETGTGANVFATSPTLVTPALGTPTSGNLANCTFPTLNQSTTGNAATVTTNANLTGDVTSVGNATSIAAGVIVNADINVSAGIVDTKLATISTAGKVSNSATTATNANTASAIVARDASGNFSAGTITANLTGTASNVTTNANLTGDVTSVGNATSIAAGVIVNADINVSAGIVDTKLATISTAGKVSNSATTATNANTASTIVARDASGNFSAGTITAALTGTASNVTTNANLTGHVTSVGNAAVLGSFTSAQLATALTDETGTGANVFATSPTLVTPALGTPTSGNLANCTFPTLNQNTTGNAATATTLQTTRTIWGQNFNGGANVTGALSGATTISASSTIQGTRLISTVATGTAPLSVTSTTVVTNLNADLLDGIDSSRILYGINGSGSSAASPTQNVYEVAQYKSGFWDVTGATWTPNNGYWWGATFAHTSNGGAYNYSGQLAFQNGNGGNGIHGRTISNGTPTGWNKLWSDGNDGAGSGLDADLLDGVDSLTYSASLRANKNITGGGTVTVDGSGNVLWSARFIIISNGKGAYFSTAGYFDVECPVTGTITGVGGAANVTATAAGIPLGAWQAIYYILPIGSNNGSVAANFRVVAYSGDANIPHDWVLICVRNNDTGRVHFNNGMVLNNGQSMNGIIQDNANTVNTLVRRDASGNFSAGTITANLTGTASNVTTNANLTGDVTSVGNATSIAAGVIVNADINVSAGIVDTKLATISTAGKVSNSATTATNANTASTIVARDASGNFSAGTITANLTGTASNVTTNANLTGDVTSVGNATSIAAGVIVNADINVSAGIVDTKLATISTAGKVSNSATTATNANTASTIVARDASGNFSAGTITAALTGTASNVTTNANLTGHVTSVGNAAVLGSFTSAQLATALTDETGSGANVFATSPTLVTPALGTPTSGNLANCTFPTLNQSTTGNAATATTLATTRTIWGQNFNGGANVTGALSGATTISASSTIQGTRLISTVATGTAPLSVTSTTVVTNLNADLLDGVDIANICSGNNGAATSDQISDMNSLTQKSGFYIRDSPSNSPETSWITWMTAMGHYSGERYGWQIARQYWSESLWTRRLTNNTWGTWRRIWDSGNDGAGSGLDADLLDGKNTGTSGNTIPLLDGANTWSNSQSYTTDIYLNTTAAERRLVFNNGTTNVFYFGQTVAGGNTYGMWDGTNGREIFKYSPSLNTFNIGRTASFSDGIAVSGRDNIASRVSSGFWETSTATTGEGWPQTTNGWTHLISCTHSNTGNYYALQLAAPFGSQRLFFRTPDSGTTTTTTAWSEVTAFPIGTTLLFYQANAPTGWTKVTTQDNKALRVVSGTGGGTGGSTAFTTVFASRTVPLPQHGHTITDVQHSHLIYGKADNAATTGSDLNAGDGTSNTWSTSLAFTGITATNDNGTAGASMDFAVQYIDVILCSKN